MSSNRSILLFGHGDGGGGPAISHLEKLKRLVNCESISRIHMNSTPDDFFHEVSAHICFSQLPRCEVIIW